LGTALAASFKDVDGVIDLHEKVVRIEVPVIIFARLEDNSSFPGGCQDV